MSTIADVAKEAGTSITTVSRVLSGQGDAYRISAPTQALVVTAAKRLDYRPSYHAKSLKAGRSQTIGLVFNSEALAHSNQAYSATIIGAIDNAVRHAGYHLLLVADKDLYEVLETGSAFLADRRVDALIVFGYVLYRYETHKLPIPLTVDQPVVVVESWGETPFPTIAMDPVPGIAAGVAHLVGLGHRRLAWVTGRIGPERVAAFRAACATHQIEARVIELDLVPVGDQPADLIAACARAVAPRFAELRDATGIMCFNELTAFGVQQALRDQGLEVPRDRSLIGFDDLYSELSLPPLTVVHFPLAEIGKRVAEMAIAMAEGTATTASLRQPQPPIPTSLVVRGSCGRPPVT